MAIVIMTESCAPQKKSKGELEQLVKSNGGKFYQTHTAAPNTICIADRSEYYPIWPAEEMLKSREGTVKVASLQKDGQINILRPSWILDCVQQNENDAGLSDFLLPQEPR